MQDTLPAFSASSLSHMLKSLLKIALPQGPAWKAACASVRPDGVTVLMYHRIRNETDPFPGTDAKTFEMQMRWLKKNCSVITPEQLGEVARKPPRSRPAVLLTFDDGFRDYHDNACPVLREMGFTGLVFLATGAMDDEVMIWTDAVTWATHATKKASVTLPWDTAQRLDIDDQPSRHKLAEVCKRFLKDIPNQQRQAWLNQLMQALEIDPDDGTLARQMLNWDEVRTTMDCTRYGGHTHNHPILSQLDAATMEAEIVTCRRRIIDETGVEPRYFAYPNGRAQDFTPMTQNLLRQHGFELGFSTIEGIHRDGDDVYAIKRQNTAGDTLGDFALRVIGR
jgi:peptidoglycan/xylan/chitin deacetylase (PgdA/CDA1 family)